MNMHKKLFTIDDGNIFIGYTDGSRWNGWATPYFPFEEAQKVAHDFNEYTEHKMQYDHIYDKFYVWNENLDDFEMWQGADVQTDEGIKHLYGIGAYSWVWDMISLQAVIVEITEFFEWEEVEPPKEFNITLETAREIIITLRGDESTNNKITTIWRKLNMIINEGNYGETLYTVTVGTGTVWTKEFKVYAYNETEAVDLVADYIEEQEMEGLYADYYEIFDCCEAGQTVNEYAEANNLTCCGNHGIYVQIINIEEGI